MPLDDDQLHGLLKDQAGVVSRRQVLAAGGRDRDIARRLRRREWARVHPGVYVDHTGPLTWPQQCWAALLVAWPATLWGETALVAHRLREQPANGTSVIEVAVDRSRCVDPPRNVRVTRVKQLDRLDLVALKPPRCRLEDAVLVVASRARNEDTAVAVVAQAVQKGRTTAGRLLEAMRRHPRLRHRTLLKTVLADVADGAHSALERRYLVNVERPHGLPTAARQRRVRPGRTIAYRDVEYVGCGTVIELDGRLGHEETGDRWNDLDRDVDSAVAGDLTVRIGWKQVLDPCRMANAIARILRARGWTGTLRACHRPDCAIGEGSPPPG